MKISITPDFETELGTVINGINGRATHHTYSIKDLFSLVERAETSLEKMGLAASCRRGARLSLRSGEKLPRSYLYRRRVTRLTCERGKMDWFLIAAEAEEIYPNQREIFNLQLTAEQYAKVHDQLDQSFNISKAEVVG